jgi:uncharacterized protein YyaL (SSP411 family)
VAARILDYVAREMTAPGGAFYSATDADSPTPDGHEEEGHFFTWTPQEVKAALGAEDAKLVAAYYRVLPAGNFEGRSILNTPRPLEVVAREHGLPGEDLRRRLSAAREKLYAARTRRAPPARDDKIIVAWNGLMISAFARAGFVLARPDYLQRAGKAASFLLTQVREEDGRLRRTYRDGRASDDAFLDDHAFLVAGLLDLFEASADGRWLREALAVQRVQDAHYADAEHGGYFMTSDDHEQLLARDKPGYDGAVPSGNSVAAMNLLRLAELTTDMTHRKRAERTLASFAAELGRGGRGLPRMLGALDFYLDVVLEVFIVHPAGTQPGALLDTLRRTFLPNAVVVVGSDAQVAALAEQVPLLAGKVALKGKPTAFVCEQGRCELPTGDPKVLAKQLSRHEPLVAGGTPAPLSLP